jgi:putative membrane protein insertion efficiency factor
MNWLQQFLVRFLVGIVKAYRLFLSPWLGSACRFEPTCSIYSIQALETHGAAKGSYLTLKRLVRCHPWCEGGMDAVPEHFSLFSKFTNDSSKVIPKVKTSS